MAKPREIEYISVRGANEHNLQNVSIDIPRGQLVVLCGVSGSGKSTLAFDTIYAEGQRRYVESLSAYARQFLGQVKKPDVESIEGLSPAVAIDQKTTSANPRSTVGTITEIHDHLRLLFARVGTPHCPADGTELGGADVSEVVERFLEGRLGSTVLIGAGHVTAKKGTMQQEMDAISRMGYTRVRIDGRLYDLTDTRPELDKNLRHDVEIIVDKIKIKTGSASRLFDSLNTALEAGNGEAFLETLAPDNTVEERRLVSRDGACETCGVSYPKIEPRTFSFNSPFGACESCTGLGVLMQGDVKLIVPDDNRALNQNAISPWSGMGGSYQRWALSALCTAHGINQNTPWKKLTKAQQNLVLDGVEGDLQATHQGKKYSIRFEGVRPWLLRRVREAATDKQRETAMSYMREKQCGACHGDRLGPYPLAVTLQGTNIASVEKMSVAGAQAWFQALSLDERQAHIAQRLVKETTARLSFLSNVGLPYITLDRSARTLSGGEAQRIRLASQIGSGLAGVLYVLDEPSIGLHPRDNQRLVGTLEALRDLGNTVLVVEHDEDTIAAADWIIDVGPGAGRHGGMICAEGTLAQIKKNKASVTGAWLSGKRSIATPKERRPSTGKLRLSGVTANNIKGLNIDIPLGLMIGVCGVSGSGKSTLVNDVLHPAVSSFIANGNTSFDGVRKITGLDALDKIINIDQSPIGRTPRSNPATYTGVFDKIRGLYAELPESKARGWKQGRYSFNVPPQNGGGRCETCQGDGTLTIEMNFLPDVHVPCERCDGLRYNAETLEVLYKKHSIADVLRATVDDARELFSAQSGIKRTLDTLHDVGLGYVPLGHSATWLSGGEAQRVKIAEQLAKRSTGKTLYILDEPTTGLHYSDVEALLGVLSRLVEGGNTVLVVEHNVDVLRSCDWLLEMGPDGGDGGGVLVASGTPEDVAAGSSPTAPYLKSSLERHSR